MIDGRLVLAGHPGTGRSDHPLFPGVSFAGVMAATYAVLSENRDADQQRDLDRSLGFDVEDVPEVLPDQTYASTDRNTAAIAGQFGDFELMPPPENEVT